jgi:hypothetical protein
VNAVGGLRGRAFGLVIVAILVVTIGLLVAGYGLAVGIGVLAGAVLGFGVGLFAFFSTWQGRGQVTFGGGTSSGSWNYLTADSSDTPASRMEPLQELTEVQGVDLGAVQSIIPVLATSEAAGLALQLLDVELREAGLVLNLDLRVAPGVLTPPSMARVSISDNVGTAYRASAQSVGGWPSRFRVLVNAIPAPPAGVRTLTIRFEEFVDPPFPHMSRPITGPWTFSVALLRE